MVDVDGYVDLRCRPVSETLHFKSVIRFRSFCPAHHVSEIREGEPGFRVKLFACTACLNLSILTSART